MAANTISPKKIAGVYIGTVVGAGFASGQEILQFFCVFGKNGFFGLILVTVLFVFFGYLIMDMGYSLKSKSHIEIIQMVGGKHIGRLADIIITFFLFGSLTAMIAGGGAMFKENFGISPVLGSLIMAVAASVTCLFGIRGVMNSISFIVPFLLAAVLCIGLFSMFSGKAGFPDSEALIASSRLLANWQWAALLYVSYNILLSISVLGPLGANSFSRKSVKAGAFLGGMGLGIGSAVIYMALLKNMPGVLEFEIPMIYIAGKMGFILQLAYAAVLLMEVYTTAVSSLFGFVSRLTDIESGKGKCAIVLTAVMSFLASRVGFTNLVKYLYPVVGYCGIVLLILLVYHKIKSFICAHFVIWFRKRELHCRQAKYHGLHKPPTHI